ncbi:hypothetical protein DFP72DRAFT_915059 [Ephemerocybe angulata]|uniref:Uncharacterized protein n=1 Tax=Ephemerocybe angulata TaxID=980116 RepID=A0A8H6LZQ7_9AGAR|nr:hypothetical protein DFP72DRAFT_915059 [Tulosesus angulatus]
MTQSLIFLPGHRTPYHRPRPPSHQGSPKPATALLAGRIPVVSSLPGCDDSHAARRRNFCCDFVIGDLAEAHPLIGYSNNPSPRSREAFLLRFRHSPWPGRFKLLEVGHATLDLQPSPRSREAFLLRFRHSTWPDRFKLLRGRACYPRFPDFHLRITVFASPVRHTVILYLPQAVSHRNHCIQTLPSAMRLPAQSLGPSNLQTCPCRRGSQPTSFYFSSRRSEPGVGTG